VTGDPGHGPAAGYPGGRSGALDARIAAAAARDLPLAASILREAIRIPADHVDRPVGAPAGVPGGDPLCGTSNHEGPRLEYLRRTIREIGALAHEDDVGYDAFGNLGWVLEDRDDGVPREEKKVVCLDGHGDTVNPLRAQWHEKTGGLDPFLGLVDAGRLDHGFLRRTLGWLPPDEEWAHVVFGRGAADQLGGVVAQIVASRILVELAPEGALRGVIVRGFVTVAEEDNEGGGPLYLTRRVLPGAPPAMIPDVVILTEMTGDTTNGALVIRRGQRGRMLIEVRVTGRSCHGSIPAEGLNPLEHGGAILAEAAERHARREGFREDPLLGAGTRTATWAELETASDCSVPERFTFRFDRRLTSGESPEQALHDLEGLESVRRARAAGLRVEIAVPVYERPTWRGYVPGNPQVYLSWLTPAEHPAIEAALATYRSVVTPHVAVREEGGGSLRREPRLGRWVFSTDGVGWPSPLSERALEVPARKNWVAAGEYRHPAMFGFGSGIMQNAHKIGEALDLRELQHAIAFLARYPSVFAAS
jgi:acetylornithine deacetylase/succinyl-diaminopimelate desuccinylase-like protein